jgi:hypothetical protein
MVYQGLFLSKPSIAETGEGCSPSEGIDTAECAIFIGTISPEEFERLKRYYV